MESTKPKIHPFEFIGAQRLFEEERFLLADEMGMFKTAQSIFANSKFRQRNSKLRTLVVCPNSVKEHWARELQKWAFPKGELNVIYAGNVNQGFRDAKKSDWTIVSYDLLSRLNKEFLTKLKETGFHHIISDEVHNAKNPDALRTRALKTLADRADYLSLLSGTPIPNTMSVLYVLMSLLDPQEYKFDPEKEVSDSENFRIARQSFLEVYQKLVETEMNVGKKIMDLAKASIDPCLVDDSLPRTRRNGNDISDKYDMLDEIVEKEMRKKDGKVLIFTDLKTGI